MTVVNLGSIEITDRQIRSSLAHAALATRMPTRLDASGAAGYDEGLVDAYRPRWDGQAINLLRQQDPRWRPDPALEQARADWAEATGRTDAVAAPGAGGFARDFEFIHQEILEEVRPVLSSQILFPVDRTLPLGWPTHTFRRVTVAGRARWHNKGDSFPIAKAGYAEETFKTGFLVCAVEQSYFEGLQLGVAGLRTYQYEADGAIRALDEYLNEVAWYGDPARQIHGVLSHPNLPTAVLPIRLTGSTGKDIAAAINLLLNTPMVVSGGRFMPNRLAVSPAIAAHLTTQPYDVNSGTSTIWEFIQKGQASTSKLTELVVVPELSAAEMTAHNAGNPAGYDGMFAFRDDKRSIRHVLPQEPTFLPVWQSSPIDTIHVAFASTGGIVMNDVGNNLLVFVRV